MLSSEIKKVREIANTFYDVNIAKLSGDFSFPEINTKISQAILPVSEVVMDAGLQFCFFLGKHTYKPVASFEISKMVKEHSSDLPSNAMLLAEKIESSGVTMVPERLDVISEISDSLEYYGVYQSINEIDPEVLFEFLMTIPTFRRDPFLKKAFLAMQSFNLPEVPAPIDYQIPKVLESLGCIRYDPDIKCKIQSSYVFRENTKEELGIRAAALKAVEKIAKVNNVTETEVDQWLFAQKNTFTRAHHLCYTTNY